MASKRKRAGFILKLCVAAFAVYAVSTLISLQMDIDRKRAETEALRAATEDQEQINAGLKRSLEAEPDDEFLAALAGRKLGLVSPGEKIFIDISR